MINATLQCTSKALNVNGTLLAVTYRRYKMSWIRSVANAN